MATTCWSSVRGKIVRLTKLDACGAPVAGPKSTLVTDGFVSVEFSPEYEDGEESSLKKADGKFAYLFKDDDQLKWYSINLKFTGVNPDALGMITGQPLVMDHSANAVGLRVGQTIPTNWALETWTDIPGVACVGTKPYGYFLAPWLHGGRLAAFTIENGAAEFTVENAMTYANSPWGTGPYNVDLNPPVPPATEPAPGKLLTPILADQHLDMHVTRVAPPTPACAASTLVLA